MLQSAVKIQSSMAVNISVNRASELRIQERKKKKEGVVNSSLAKLGFGSGYGHEWMGEGYY